YKRATQMAARVEIIARRNKLSEEDTGALRSLRDLETHEPRPGCTMGDIGPKIGYNNVDNGYCKFDRVRIPRQNMGMRTASVDRQGSYTKNEDVPQEILYFTMLQTRMSYSNTELKVLDYQSQQYRLFPLLAAAYAITLTGNNVDAFTKELSQQMQKGNMSMLNLGHAISCGLKACGGHGYLQSSGIPVLLGDLLQTVTAEGENYVLSLQVLGAFRAGSPLPDSMKYIANIDQAVPTPRARSAQQWLEPATYVSAFQQRFLYQLRALERKVSASASAVAGIQNHSVACYKLSMAYSRLLLVSGFADAVRSRASASSEREVSAALLSALRLLSHLFALTQLEAEAGEFMESGGVLPAELPLVRANVEALLVQLRPHAVVLVDGFNFSDHALNTTLGRYDGQPYEALYASAQHDPVNHGSDKVALHELLLPIRAEIAREARARL
ncbi:hypothetical protein PybrP1_008287, partial [[Pythium] brassicae (nom. inval.)]